MTTNKNLIGKRIQVLGMVDEPRPIEIGSFGTITWNGGGIINVDWDNGRKLGLVIGHDTFIIFDIIEEERWDVSTIEQRKYWLGECIDDYDGKSFCNDLWRELPDLITNTLSANSSLKTHYKK